MSSLPSRPGHGEQPRCTLCSDIGWLPAGPGRAPYDFTPCPACSQSLLTWVPDDADEPIVIVVFRVYDPTRN
jgi:hypothetical protein